MSIYLKCKNSFSSRLRTQAQRFTHTVAEQNTRPYRKNEGYDSVPHQNFVLEMSKWKKIDANRLGVHRSKIPPYAWAVLKNLHDRGYPVYLVGGCVRDFLLNKVPEDIDVVTTATLGQVKRMFRSCLIIGKKFPICRVRIRDSIVEVSSFGTVPMHSKEKGTQLIPKKPVGCNEIDFICWKDSIRRDFTINSLFFDPFQNKICDYANGMEDIRTLKLRTLKPACISFQEDCARILRGLRIAGRLGLSISKDTELAIGKLASSVENLEKVLYRIMMELNYMLAYGAAESTMYLLQRFNLLELFLPFHAAYLNQQFNKTSSWSSVMLMKMFFNLDKLVTCDRPCHCTLWLGLLAFHQALVTKPQDAFIVWVFASVLYHGSWKDGIRFARKYAKLQVNFVPEISGFCNLKSDDEVSEEVSHLAALVQDSVAALGEADVLDQSMYKDQYSSLSGLVFVSKKIGKDVGNLFDVLVHEIESYKHGRESFVIDHKQLGKGIVTESRFVLGEIILETLSAKDTKYGNKQSDSLLQEKHTTCPSNPGFDENIPKKHKVVKVQSLAQTEKTVPRKSTCREKHATVQNRKSQEMSRENNIQRTESRSSNRSESEASKHTMQSHEVAKEKSGSTLLSSLFRR